METSDEGRCTAKTEYFLQPTGLLRTGEIRPARLTARCILRHHDSITPHETVIDGKTIQFQRSY
jgi:hypothetical protein